MRYVRNTKSGLVFDATPELLKQAADLNLEILDDDESDAHERALGLRAAASAPPDTPVDGETDTDEGEGVASLPGEGEQGGAAMSAEALAAALAGDANAPAAPAALPESAKPAAAKSKKPAAN